MLCGHISGQGSTYYLVECLPEGRPGTPHFFLQQPVNVGVESNGCPHDDIMMHQIRRVKMLGVWSGGIAAKERKERAKTGRWVAASVNTLEGEDFDEVR